MVETGMKILHLPGLVLGALILPSVASAHRLDEYLQATLVTIDSGEVRLQINLTPGVAVAEQVLALIDRDHDGTISTNEARVYSELLQEKLTVRLDGRKLSLKIKASDFPPVSELLTGWGIIQLEFTAHFPSLAPGEHHLTLKNRHLPSLSVYLLNAARPKAGLEITKQRRNKNQSSGEIEFRISTGKAQMAG